MEIEVFNASLKVKRGRELPVIRFSKSGMFSLNTLSVKALNLVEGSTISFVRDKSNPKDWYIHLDPDGCRLRSSKTELTACLKVVKNELNKSFPGFEDKTLIFRVATEPVQVNGYMMYAILTSKPL